MHAEQIPGIWLVASSERDGKAEPGDQKDPLQLEFTDKTFRFRLPGGARHPQSYKLDPTAKPKAIDWVGGKNGPTKPVPGIYQLDGEQLVELKALAAN